MYSGSISFGVDWMRKVALLDGDMGVPSGLRPMSARRAKERAKALFMVAVVLCRQPRISGGSHVEGRIVERSTVQILGCEESHIYLPLIHSTRHPRTSPMPRSATRVYIVGL
jgi:hypothetical protein